ncbi:MAG: biopolymer transporter ExbD [Planctomycetota bacterium]
MRLPPAESDDDGPNLTPVIDVVFLLLVFFLVATRFDQQEREVQTKLAQVLQARPRSMGPNEVVVNISDKGEYVVMQESLDEQQLADLLHSLSLKNPSAQKVQIRADERVAFKYPAWVMGVCEQEKLDHYCTVLQQQ